MSLPSAGATGTSAGGETGDSTSCPKRGIAKAPARTASSDQIILLDTTIPHIHSQNANTLKIFPSNCYCQIVTKNSLNKDDTVFIGDSNHEIEVGKKLGIKTVAVTWGFNSENKLKSHNPDFIAHNSEELGGIISG